MRVQPRNLTLIGCMALLLLVGCTPRYPLNMTEAEWHALAPEQQLDARERQRQLDLQAAEQRAEAARERAAEERRQAAALEQRRRNAAFGERVQCVLDNAELMRNDKWRAANPVALDMVTGETASFRLLRQGSSSGSVRAEASFDGQTVRVCRSGMRDCDVMVGTSRDYQRGMTKRISVRKQFRGDLRCELPHSGSARPERPPRPERPSRPGNPLR